MIMLQNLITKSVLEIRRCSSTLLHEIIHHGDSDSKTCKLFIDTSNFVTVELCTFKSLAYEQMVIKY